MFSVAPLPRRIPNSSSAGSMIGSPAHRHTRCSGDCLCHPWADSDMAFVCFSGDCLRHPWVDSDMGVLLCFVCDQKDLNQRAVHSLYALLSKNTTPTPDGTPTFQNLLAVEGLSVKMLEGVLGDGWDGQCVCRLCKRDWLNAGWVCPDLYRWIYGPKDRRLYRQKQVDTAGSAQPPPASHSRRHSRSRSRRLSSHSSRVVQPAHIR